MKKTENIIWIVLWSICLILNIAMWIAGSDSFPWIHCVCADLIIIGDRVFGQKGLWD